MAQVITLENYRPIARYDGVAFTQARIEESATTSPNSSYTGIETINLSTLPGGVDSDPTSPASRNLTTNSASDTANLWYRVVFIDAASNETVPTDPVQNTTSSNVYTTVADLKATLSITSSTYDADLNAAVVASSRAIDRYCGQRFYLDSDATNVRYFDALDAGYVAIDACASVATVAIDNTGSRDYATFTSYETVPYNAADDNEPYTGIEITPTSGTTFPRTRKGVKVTGQWGWPEVPGDVVEACSILASRYYKRAREAAFGVAAIGIDGQAIRISRIDPDVASLLDPYVKRRLIV